MSKIMFPIFKVIFSAAILGVPLVTCAPTLEFGPADKTVIERTRTSFICDVNDDFNGEIFWKFVREDGKRSYLSSNEYIYPSAGRVQSNYEVAVNRQNKSYELILHSPEIPLDTGTYQCGYVYGYYRTFAILARATLTIQSSSESQTCNFRTLPKRVDGQPKEIEVTCNWSHDQGERARFKSNGHAIEPDIRYSNHIISRIASRDITYMNCSVGILDNSADIETVCVSLDDNDAEAQGIIRVDPFINEKTVGSNATFTCTSPDSEIQASMSWNVVDGGKMENRVRIATTQNVMTIINVTTEDESMMIECRVSTAENTVVSSFASLNVVESTTSSDRRPPGESQGNKTKDIPTTRTFVITATQAVRPNGQNIGGTFAALSVILIIIFTFTVIIFVMIHNRRRKSVHNKRKSEGKHTGYETIEVVKVPHTMHEGSSQLYALSLNDKQVRQLQTLDKDSVQDGRQKSQMENSLSVPYKVLDKEQSSTNEKECTNHDNFLSSKISSQADESTLLNHSYISIQKNVSSGNVNAVTKATAKSSTPSKSTNHIWRSQRMTKKALEHPPKARHVLSYRSPTPRDQNASGEYTRMTVEQNETSLHGCGDNVSRTESNQSDVYNISSHKERDPDYDYADISEIVRNAAYQSNHELDIDAYRSLSNLSRPLHDSKGALMKMAPKTSTIHRIASTREAPPKPQRGKCQSQLIVGIASSDISDYEVMIKGSKVHVDETDNDGSINNDDVYAPSNNMSNRLVRETRCGRESSTNEEIAEDSGYDRVLWTSFLDKDNLQMKRTGATGAGKDGYEHVCLRLDSHERSSMIPETSCYSHIQDVRNG